MHCNAPNALTLKFYTLSLAVRNLTFRATRNMLMKQIGHVFERPDLLHYGAAAQRLGSDVY